MFKLTIITITKDNPEQLKKTINSLSGLTRRRGVVHLIIDTSRPEIRKRNQSWLKPYKSIRYHEGDWSGIAKSYNYGLSLVKNGWVWLLNASDYLHPKVNLNTLINLLRDTTYSVLVFNVEGYQSGHTWQKPSPAQIKIPINWVPQPGVIMRKEIFDRVGSFNEKLLICLDTDYWIRLFSLPEFSYLYNNLLLVQYDERGISSNNPKLIAHETLQIFTKHLSQTLSYTVQQPLLMLNIIFHHLKSLLIGNWL